MNRLIEWIPVVAIIPFLASGCVLKSQYDALQSDMETMRVLALVGFTQNSASSSKPPVDTPQFELAAGAYFGTRQTIVNVASPVGAAVIYTEDGTTPTADADCNAVNGTKVTAGTMINITRTGLHRAIGCNSGVVSQAEASVNYTIKFRMFVLSSALAGGDLKTQGGGVSGVAGADLLCNSDSNRPSLSSTYKALLVDTTNRIASVSPSLGDGQVDWILKPNADYYRSDGTTKIMTTNDDALFIFGSLDNAVSLSGTSTYWTGIAPDWTTSSGYHCSDWSSSSVGDTGRFGNRTQTNSSAFSGSAYTCDSTLPGLLCVEQ